MIPDYGTISSNKVRIVPQRRLYEQIMTQQNKVLNTMKVDLLLWEQEMNSQTEYR